MTVRKQPQPEASPQARAIARWDNEGGAAKPVAALPAADAASPLHEPGQALSELAIDDSEHSRDGLLMRTWDRDDAVTVTAFISREVLDDWVHEEERPSARKSLFRAEYTALGRDNLPAIERIVAAKYRSDEKYRDAYPFVDVLLADIVASGEHLDLGSLARL